MKYLLCVLFVLALFCGFSSVAHAAEIDFHVQVLDPNGCDAVSVCTVMDPTAPTTISFLPQVCTNFSITADGCLVLVNDTASTTFFNLFLSFTVPTGTNATCDTDATFASALCGASGNVATFSFTGGPGLLAGHSFVIAETGIPPAGLVGTASVNVTPEPDSLLLLSTGVMMMAGGLFMKRRSFAFGKR